MDKITKFQKDNIVKINAYDIKECCKDMDNLEYIDSKYEGTERYACEKCQRWIIIPTVKQYKWDEAFTQCIVIDGEIVAIDNYNGKSNAYENTIIELTNETK